MMMFLARMSGGWLAVLFLALAGVAAAGCAEAARERELRSRMILQVHDELIFEGPSDEADEVASLLADVMPASLSLRVPLKVDLKRGRTWAEL